MTTETRLTLPWPPSVNSYWRSVKGRNILSAKGREYQAQAWGAILKAGVKRVAGPVRLELRLFPPDDRNRDSDNYNKAVFDALVHGKIIEGDDRKIVRGHSVDWVDTDRTNPRVEIVIRRVAE